MQLLLSIFILQAQYLHEDPNQDVITQRLHLLQPHAAKWRIVANAFNISPDSLGIHKSDEDFLRALLVQCAHADQHDFQFKFDNIVERLNKEAEVEGEMTSKQGSLKVINQTVSTSYM